MALGTKLFCILLWISCLYGVSIFIFTKGFLLKRLEIPNKSDCSIRLEEQSVFSMMTPEESVGPGDTDPSDESLGSRYYIDNTCTAQKRFNKAVLILIDALRYDFLLYDESCEKTKVLPFQNKLPIIKTLLDRNPSQSLLYQFIADPPTTTMQRLKGLTTGSLPTFVDVGNNFASANVEEDNIIHQLVNAHKNVTFMGDDTWVSLFPDKFAKSFPFPSFNVKDLHSVDNGIMRHLLPEMNRSDWNILITHFLGVDHCGHRYGPYHSAMGEKLSQMNEMISLVADNLDNDTILLIFGDHGMTGTGDHGGDSDDELKAGLFFYSKKDLRMPTKTEMNTFQTISQIDLVPSLSLLLGIPIPFSSLGMLIPELFMLGADDKSPELQNQLSVLSEKYHPAYLKMEALRINALQVKRYLDTYSRRADEFPYHIAAVLEQKFTNAETLFHNLQKDLSSEEVKIAIDGATAMYMEYLSGVKEMCRRNWAKFDLLSMACGVVLIVSTSLATWVVLNFVEGIKDRDKVEENLNSLLGNMLTGMITIFPMSVLITSQVEDLMTVKTTILLFFPALGSILGSLLCVLQTQGVPSLPDVSFYIKRTPKESFCASGLLVLYVVSLTSNSFVVYEDRTTVFLLQTSVLLLYLVSGIKSLTRLKKIKSRDIGRILTHPVAIVTYLLLAFQTCVRLSSSFRTCREEQVPCTQSDLLQPLLVFDPENTSYNNLRYIKAVFSICSISFLLRFWLKKQGNLNGTSIASICIKYALPLNSFFIFLHWGMQSLPEKILDKLPAWQQTFLAKCVYGLTTISVVSIIWQPLLIHILERRTESKRKSHGVEGDLKDQIVPRLFDHIKSNIKEKQEDEKNFETPAVFGLATTYSACLLQVIVTIVLLLSMLLGDGFAPSLGLLCIQVLLFLELVACIRRAQLKVFSAVPELQKIALLHVPWYIIFSWGLMASEFFFVTGHHATFPSIQFEAGFVGFHGDFPVYLYWVPAILIGANTFAANILFALSLPLVLLWPFTRGRLEDKNSDKEGEVVLRDHATELRIGLFRLMVLYILFHGFKLLGCMFSAAVHRRHLMIWKIFAPRYIFDGIGFLITLTFVLLAYLLVLRTDNQLAKWLARLFRIIQFLKDPR
ncbi:GPI ethanolamine phosphate transferase 3-like [Antedon mediterranea]|uniref:GPI ethanolamine phosphate transferase 3-like n=1 Tax=Antedon mediterranea TaxID=105859 RepID=UPI003AF91913